MKLHELEQRFINLLPRLEILDWGEGSERMEQMLDNTKDLVIHGEPGVALENLCQNLYEFSVPICQENLNKLRELGDAMKMSPETWNLLNELIT